MRHDEALAVMGLEAVEAADHTVLRAAYRRRIRAAHPDLNPAADASERTARLATAYRLLLQDAPEPPAARGAGCHRPSSTAGHRSTSQSMVTARVLDATTVRVDGSREEAFAAVVEASHRLGEIGYLDSAAALVEVIVEFVEAPTSSLVMSLQGRGQGYVEVFCAVEPLSGGESPPVEAVTRLVASTLAGIEVADLAV